MLGSPSTLSLFRLFFFMMTSFIQIVWWIMIYLIALLFTILPNYFLVQRIMMRGILVQSYLSIFGMLASFLIGRTIPNMLIITCQSILSKRISSKNASWLMIWCCIVCCFAKLVLWLHMATWWHDWLLTATWLAS